MERQEVEKLERSLPHKIIVDITIAISSSVDTDVSQQPSEFGKFGGCGVAIFMNNARAVIGCTLDRTDNVIQSWTRANLRTFECALDFLNNLVQVGHSTFRALNPKIRVRFIGFMDYISKTIIGRGNREDLRVAVEIRNKIRQAQKLHIQNVGRRSFHDVGKELMLGAESAKMSSRMAKHRSHRFLFTASCRTCDIIFKSMKLMCEHFVHQHILNFRTIPSTLR